MFILQGCLPRRWLLLCCIAGMLLRPERALSQASHQANLPPELKWNGKSQSLIVSKKDPWITPAEQSDFARTPRYEETMQWLQRLTAAAPELKMISLGKSPEGRDLWMVIASKERAFTPAALRATGKPIFLAQAGIHAGEIDGKDAGMMLLRDMTACGTKRDLLDKANFLFVPILNVDGHERFSPYGRINQRGPAETGWRTNARNLNLNRDYAKLDTPEVRAIIRALNEWAPDLYFDIQWGFFLETLTPTEYVEAYVMQPMAERMLAEDAQLKAEFEQKLRADSTFAQNAQDRLQWFYQRTPFYDEHHLLYPVAREVSGKPQ